MPLYLPLNLKFKAWGWKNPLSTRMTQQQSTTTVLYFRASLTIQSVMSVLTPKPRLHTNRLVLMFCKLSQIWILFTTLTTGEVIHPDLVPQFVDNLQLHHMSDIASCVNWKEWKRDFFISEPHALYPQNQDDIDMIFLQAVKNWRLLYDYLDETAVNKFSSLYQTFKFDTRSKRMVTRFEQWKYCMINSSYLTKRIGPFGF